MSNSRHNGGALWNLLKLEVKKVSSQNLFLTGAGIIFLFTLLNFLGFLLHRMRSSAKTFQGEMIAELLNGLAFSMYCLVPAIYVLLPMLICIFSSVNFAGEMENGLMRITLLRPVSKWNIYLSKFLVTSGISIMLIFVLMGLSFAAGCALFGTSGDILIMGQVFFGNEKMYILNESVVFRRFIIIYLIATLSIPYLVAMYMMFSAITRKVSHAIVISLGIYYTSYIIGAMPFMRHIHPFLPTRYLANWRFIVIPKIPWERVIHDSMTNTLYIAGFLIVGLIVFEMSDN